MSDQAKQTDDIRVKVREHYGQIAEKYTPEASSGCCGSPEESASSCCGGDSEEAMDTVSMLYQADDVGDLPADVTDLSLGCGDPVTLATLEAGQTVLDLGSGAGIDCFLAAKRVGPTGHVIGVDMTASMIEKARANKAKIGAQNVEFRLGEIEHLPVADASADVIISNCVINLSPDKSQVFREAYRALKPGGRLAVSDIVTDGPLPEPIRKSLDAWAGCVGGALDVHEYLGALEEAGFVDVGYDHTFTDEEMEKVAEDAGMQKEAGNGAGEGTPKVILQTADGQQQVIELDESFTPESLKHKVFSAKITARKPA